MRTLITFLSAVALLAACETKKNYVVVDDDDTGTGGSIGPSGSGGNPSYGEGCEGLCAKVVDADCGADTELGCVAECNALYDMTPESCTGSLDSLVSCQIASGTPVCEGGNAKMEGCDTQGGDWFTCVQTMGTGGGGAGGGTTTDCYMGAECNPLEPSSCGSGAACDVANDNQLHCFPPPNTAPIGGACDLSSGPFCAQGGTCIQGTCRSFCCSQADCTTGTCQPFNTNGPVPLSACF